MTVTRASKCHPRLGHTVSDEFQLCLRRRRPSSPLSRAAGNCCLSSLSLLWRMGKSGHDSPLPSPRRTLYALLAIGAGLMVDSLASAQSISTSIQVPPLQWINLTGLLNGPAPPPLKDASIGYDDTSRSLLIFGGESSEGIPQSLTYL